jgi:hypothetical protein
MRFRVIESIVFAQTSHKFRVSFKNFIKHLGILYMRPSYFLVSISRSWRCVFQKLLHFYHFELNWFAYSSSLVLRVNQVGELVSSYF